MGRRPVEKMKKKKGRPSLLELQKRALLEKGNRSPDPPNPIPIRRSTRRNPNPEPDQIAQQSEEKEEEVEEDEEDDDDDEESNGRRKEKKLKLVLKLPSTSSPNVNSRGESGEGSCGSDDSDGEAPVKKRKINAVGGDALAGSARENVDRQNSGSKPVDNLPGTLLDSGGAIPLPDKKLLLSIVDRLQKKDTYGVFAEPVDPDELPDYHEVIENPMDFSTVKKKLSSGCYITLEQLENDVFLISSNAMRYNAPDTIYFRQARSIQELAKKSFDNLRQGGDGNVTEVKTARRGRPPGKSSSKRLIGRPALDRAGSDFSSNATLATTGDSTPWSSSILDFSGNARTSDKFSITDFSARNFFGSRNGESYNWLTERRSDRNDEFSGSTLKVAPKVGKQILSDDNRRSTYKPFHQSALRNELLVLPGFDVDRKQLTPVGLHMEHTYARSLARYAANLGPVAWKIASKRIERVLPAGMKFGPGWVGEFEETQSWRPRLLQPPTQQTLMPLLTPSQQPPAQPQASHEAKSNRFSERQEQLNNPELEADLSRNLPPSASTSTVSNKSTNLAGAMSGVGGMNYESSFSSQSGVGGGSQPRPPFQLRQNPAIYSGLNGLNSGFGFNLAAPAGKLTRPMRPTGNFSLEASMASRIFDMASRSNNGSIHPTPMNHGQVEGSKLVASSNSIGSVGPLPESRHDNEAGSESGLHSQSSCQGQPQRDLVPPDLNVQFPSPGSPASGMLVDSQQPDLALQL